METKYITIAYILRGGSASEVYKWSLKDSLKDLLDGKLKHRSNKNTLLEEKEVSFAKSDCILRIN